VVLGLRGAVHRHRSGQWADFIRPNQCRWNSHACIEWRGCCIKGIISNESRFRLDLFGVIITLLLHVPRPLIRIIRCCLFGITATFLLFVPCSLLRMLLDDNTHYLQAARFPDLASGDTCNHASITWSSNDCTVQSFTTSYVAGVGDVHAVAVLQVVAHYAVATHGCAYIKDGQCLQCTDCAAGSTGIITATVTVDWVFDLSVIAPAAAVGVALAAPPTITIANLQPCGGAPGSLSLPLLRILLSHDAGVGVQYH
jgi:hypothetical protein